VLIEDHHLFHHLWALKQFLFLGQGDFISSLIEALQQAELEQNTLMRSTFEDNDRWSHVFQKQALMAIMDGALKSSNAKDLPLYVLERLQIQFVFPVASSKSFVAKDATESGCEEITENVARDNFGDFSNQIGGGLWDGLVLEYIVPDQLVSIVHPEAVATYRMVFQFLFGLKVVEYRLDATWRQSAAIQHALQIHCQNNGIRVANNVGYSQATVLLRNISITREAMIHLVRNLKSYVMLDVLEGGWKDLVQRVEAGSTLDHVIDAHQIYLQDIVRKCWMLRTDSSANTDSSITSTISTTDIDSKAKRQWKKLLCLVNEFCAFQEEIFTESLQAAQFASEKRREADKRKDGNWVFQQEATEEETFFFLADTSKLLSVIRMSEAFHQGVTDLLASLHSKINSPGDQLADDYEQGGSNSGLCEGQTDLDSLRFLTFQLDCNNYYGSIMSS
jgi:gamma-tubulin complex component 3